MLYVCLLLTEDICSLSAADICSVPTEDIFFVERAGMCPLPIIHSPEVSDKGLCTKNINIDRNGSRIGPNESSSRSGFLGTGPAAKLLINSYGVVYGYGHGCGHGGYGHVQMSSVVVGRSTDVIPVPLTGLTSSSGAEQVTQRVSPTINKSSQVYGQQINEVSLRGRAKGKS